MSEGLKLVMIGDGNMGRRISGLADSHGFTLHKQLGLENNRNGAGITQEIFEEADVAIDFTHPDVMPTHIRCVLELGTPLVVGTTGWLNEENRKEVTALTEKHGGRLLYGSNFSLGVQLFIKLARQAGQLMGSSGLFDANLHEVHHTGKADAPSGTAITLAEQYLAGSGKQKPLRYGIPERGKADTSALRVTSQRLGGVYGEHQLRLHSEWDDIELTHRARSRDGFAAGALKAASWLVRQPAGFYLIEDVVEDVLNN